MMKEAKGKRVLLLNPPSVGVYEKSKVRAAMEGGYAPSLTLAVLAAPILENQNDIVRILDLSSSKSPQKELTDTIEKFVPNIVGITFATLMFNSAAELCNIVKQFDNDILVVGGGPHASALPEDCLRSSRLDVVVIGEGDLVFRDLVRDKALNSLNGICYRQHDKIIKTAGHNSVENLDSLPYPAWHLFDIKKYKPSRLLCRTYPIGLIETSRGCIFGCEYCNKSVFGRSYRAKSSKRVVSEIDNMLDMGFKEIHIADDGFTTDLKRAKKICDLVKEKKLSFVWNLSNGIRIDRLDEEFLKKAHNCGCYSITIGIESGDQHILDRIKKGITLEQARRAVRLIKDSGIEVVAYFMLGLPGETKETMQRTIDFAKELDPDVAKASITLPLPGTPLHSELDRSGFLNSKDWSLYNQHDPRRVYRHPNLDWETIYEYYDKFYREFYLRPTYVFKRAMKSMINGHLLEDISAFLKTRW